MSDAKDQRKQYFAGRAVRNGQLIYSSVSQIVLADPAQEGCLRKWAYPYVFGIKLKKTDAQVAGSDEYAQNLEHYLKTGEDVMSPILQEAKKFLPAWGPDLEVEQPLARTGPNEKGVVVPGGGLIQAIAAREAYLKTGDARQLVAVKAWAGLTAAGVPLEGAADYRHMRGEYIDENAELQKELPGMVVCETVDLKTTSRIDPHRIKRGINAGTILPGRAKTAAQICAHPQMLGYGVYIADREPSLTHVRLAHVYAQTSSKKSVKRMGLLSVDEVRRRWRETVEPTVEKMAQVAGAAKIEDVEPNTYACDAYTHIAPDGTTQPGCGHKYYCPLSSAQVHFNIQSNAEAKESLMTLSLFDQMDAPTQPTAPAPPSSPPLEGAAYDAAVAAERAKWLQGVDGYTPGQGCEGNGFYKNQQTGIGFVQVEPGHVCRPGICAAPTTAFVALSPPTPPAPPPPPPAVVGAAAPTTAVSAPLPPPPPVFNAIVPPDAPPIDPIAAADPPPAAEIAQIEDPELRAKVEEHARLHAERNGVNGTNGTNGTVQDISADKANVWCAGGKQRVELTMEIFAARKIKCAVCGKMNGIKPAKEGDKYFATIPRHKPEAAVPAAPSAQPHILFRGELLMSSLPPAPPPLPPDVLPGQLALPQSQPALEQAWPQAPSQLPTPPLPPAFVGNSPASLTLSGEERLTKLENEVRKLKQIVAVMLSDDDSDE